MGEDKKKGGMEGLSIEQWIILLYIKGFTGDYNHLSLNQ